MTLSNTLITLYRSTGKVANLTIKATLSNCILHRRGRVTVEGCKLQCHAAGLEHLFTPLVTLAAAGLTKQLQRWPVVTGKEAGMGVLSVVETKIRVSMHLQQMYYVLLHVPSRHCFYMRWLSIPGSMLLAGCLYCVCVLIVAVDLT